MRRLARATFGVCALAWGLTLGSGIADAQSPSATPAPRVTLALSKPPYLASAESVKATVSLENPAPSELTYQRFSISFLVRGDDGKIVERRKRTFYSVAPKPGRLAAGQRTAFDIYLPVCAEKGGTCTMHVAVKLPVVTGGEHVDLVTPEVSYAIVAGGSR